MKEQAVLDARALRIRARRDTSTLLAGAYMSAFRGPGLTFEELRDYVPGDDVRWIEWNATARLDRLIVKRMREERDLVLALIVDLSASLDFGFAGHSKRDAARRAGPGRAHPGRRRNQRAAGELSASDAIGVTVPLGACRGTAHREADDADDHGSLSGTARRLLPVRRLLSVGHARSPVASAWQQSASS